MQKMKTSKSVKRKRQPKILNIFTDDEDEQLIQFVKRNRCLYDVNDTFYRHKTIKVMLWKKIASELNRTCVYLMPLVFKYDNINL